MLQSFPCTSSVLYSVISAYRLTLTTWVTLVTDSVSEKYIGRFYRKSSSSGNDADIRMGGDLGLNALVGAWS